MTISACVFVGGFAAQRADRLLRQSIADQATWQPVVLIGPLDPSSSASVRISRSSCDSLTSSAAVVRAGLIVDQPSDEVTQLGPQTPVAAVSGSLVDFAGAQAGVGAAIATTPSDRSLGGRRLGRFTSTRLAPAPGPLGLNSAVVTPLDPSRRDGPVCAMVLDHFASPERLAPSLVAQLSVVGGPITARFDREGEQRIRYLERLEAWLPSAIGLALAIVAGVITFARRSHLAAYRLSGSSRADVVGLVVAEHLIITGAGAVAVVSGVVGGGVPAGMMAPLLLAGLVAPSLSAVLFVPLAGGLLAPNPLRFANDV